MSGVQQAEVKEGRTRFVAHSGEAFKLVNKWKIGAVKDFAEPSEIFENTEGIIGRIVSKRRISQATDFPVILFRIKVTTGLEHIRLGSRLYVSISESSTQRPYTVCSIEKEDEIIEFAIKIYPEGRLTSLLAKLRLNDVLSLSNPIERPPIPHLPTSPALLVFLAGGTGMVPMMSYFDECAKIALGGFLLWWVRNEEDLFLLDKLEVWTKSKNVRVVYFFTQPLSETSDSASSRRIITIVPSLIGRISSSTILEAFGHSLPVNPAEIAWIMSGPEGFITSALDAVSDVGAPSNRIISLD
jgi:NAD(P)H-flavin reductase